MALILNVGANRKAGLPNYGSVGSSVALTIELDATLLTDPTALAERIAQAQGVVAQAVETELARLTGQDAPRIAQEPVGATPGNGRAQQPRTAAEPPRQSPGEEPRGGKAPASPKQLRCLYGRAKALGIDVDDFLADLGIVQPEQLTVRACSDAIDALGALAPRK
jgi:hypothetical protein